MHAFVLMTNHVHFLLEAMTGQLSEAFRWVHGGYASHFNFRHRRTGHLFENRYKSFAVRTLAYFRNSSIYIHKNPMKAGMVAQAWDYLWSSARALAGLSPAPAWLETRKTLEIVGGVEGFRALCSSGLAEVELEEVRCEILGPEGYAIGRVLDGLVPDADIVAPRASQPFVAAHQILEVLMEEGIGLEQLRERRNDTGLPLFLLREVSGLPLQQLSEMSGTALSTVSEKISRARQQLLSSGETLEKARQLVRRATNPKLGLSPVRVPFYVYGTAAKS